MPTGHWVPPGSRLPALVVSLGHATLLVGRGSQLGAVEHAGSVTFVRDVHVQGDLVVGRDAVLGHGCRVTGAIRAGGRVVLQQGSAGTIEAGGDVLLAGACRVGTVKAGGDIRIVGEPKTGKLEPGGRVVARPW